MVEPKPRFEAPNYSHILSWKIVLMICFLIYILNLKLKKATTSLTRGIKKPCSEVALQTRESLKKPYFPLPLSILVGTNLIMLLLLLLFCNPHLIPKKIHPPFDFWENSSSFDFRENPFTLRKTKRKLLFFFTTYVFWICSRVLFAFMPLDLNFTNPKFTIFEPG